MENVEIVRIAFRRTANEWHATEKTTRPWPVVSLKDTMGTMGRDPPDGFLAISKFFFS